jgi:subtilisin family serine protease
MQLDPGLKQLLLRRTGATSMEEVPAEFAGQDIAVVAKLRDPARAVASFHPVARFGSIVTGRVALGAVGQVRRDPNVLSLKASRGFSPGLSHSVPEAGAVDVPLSSPDGSTSTARGRGVIVAVIDWGCDFVHANFRRADGSTRLIGLWDQRGGASDRSPPELGYGRHFDRAAIDAALREPDPYKALEYDPFDIDPRGAGTHGTHVLDIAAGNGSAPGAAPGVAPEAELLFVHLRASDTLPTDTLGDSVSLLEAVRWVIDQAGECPVAINLSMGRHCGPHDGSTPLEQAMDAVLDERPGRAIVMSTGNYFDARVHSAGRLEASRTVDLAWEALPRNDETSELEVWYPGGDRFSVDLVGPQGRVYGSVALGEDLIVRDDDTILASLYHRADDPNNHDNHLEVFLWPDAPVGRWLVRLHGEQVHDGRFHSWIERDDAGSQSRFPGDQAVQQATTNTICNGHRPIVVGAYGLAGDERVLLPFSSCGPTRDGRAKPDLVAPGGSIRAARSSRIVDGVRTRDELTVKSGTSMAAPHVTGAAALMFEAAGENRLGIEEVRAILQHSARPLRLDDHLDRERAGAGALNTSASVAAVKQAKPPAEGAELTPAPQQMPATTPSRGEETASWPPGTTVMNAPHEAPFEAAVPAQLMMIEALPHWTHASAVETFTGLARALPSMRRFRRAAPAAEAVRTQRQSVSALTLGEQLRGPSPPSSTRPRSATTTSEVTMTPVQPFWSRDDEAIDGSPEAVAAFEWLTGVPRPVAPRPLAIVPMQPSVEAVRFRRKNATWLTADEQRHLRDAVNGLAATNTSSASRPWGRLVDLHRSVISQIHGVAPFWPWASSNWNTVPFPPPAAGANLDAVMQFLPWHRMFIRMFELELQRIDPTVSLPYWDWTTVRRLPGWATDLTPAIVTDAQGTLAISRTAGPSTVSPDSSGPRDFDNLPMDNAAHPDISGATRLTSYTAFTCELEMQHNRPHGWVGSTMGRLATAAADFCFYLHHANIDRIWCLWQRANPGSPNPRSTTALPLGSLSAPVIGGRTISTIGDVESVANLEYDYA